jgi:hypothetical protein
MGQTLSHPISSWNTNKHFTKIVNVLRPMVSMRKRGQLILLVIAVIGLAGGAWLMFKKPNDAPPKNAVTDQDKLLAVVDLPEIAASRFANTSKDAKYIGPKACAKCHVDQHASFLETPHSRALGDVDVDNEPTQTDFIHARSKREYEVVRKSKRVWHRESFVSKSGEKTLLAEYPIKYTIGSGHHSRSYLVESDGFLLESPVTWYSSKKSWAVSPGYDVAHSPSFSRVADMGCVHCHVGRAEPIDGNRYRSRILDPSISCESCHGPGSLHAEKHKDGGEVVDTLDLTIVNPSHLTRAESEAACAQCHLRGDASVVLRGRSLRDFRPGLRLNDFRADYVLEQPDQSMKVVGHVEQMRLSRCYKETKTLTCTTCHDPHAKPPTTERLQHFRQKCLACHADKGCGLELETRLKKNKQDDCVACHMPQSPTDIPHFAFTHHRIAVHKPDASSDDQVLDQIGRLVPMLDLDHLPEIERKRCLGLAYFEFSDKQKNEATHTEYRKRAIELLETVSKAGLHDRDVESTLARVYWEQGDLTRAIKFATAALKSEGTSGATANAMFILSDSYVLTNHPHEAIPLLKKLVAQRRQSEDWFLLALCRRSAGEITKAIAALEQAAKITPSRVDVRQMLIRLYSRSGKSEQAAIHQRIVNALAED